VGHRAAADSCRPPANRVRARRVTAVGVVLLLETGMHAGMSKTPLSSSIGSTHSHGCRTGTTKQCGRHPFL
jgi:hypothetical protein